MRHRKVSKKFFLLILIHMFVNSATSKIPPTCHRLLTALMFENIQWMFNGKPPVSYWLIFYASLLTISPLCIFFHSQAMSTYRLKICSVLMKLLVDLDCVYGKGGKVGGKRSSHHENKKKILLRKIRKIAFCKFRVDPSKFRSCFHVLQRIAICQWEFKVVVNVVMPPPSACSSCNSNFSLFKRRNKCRWCVRIFCAGCLLKEKICKRCDLIFNHPMKENLMKMKTKVSQIELRRRCGDFMTNFL